MHPLLLTLMLSVLEAIMSNKPPLAPITPTEVLQQMRPASGIEPEPSSWWETWTTWLTVAGVVIVAAVLGGIVARYLGRRRTHRSAANARDRALRELADVDGLDLPDQGDYAQYADELLAIVRRYFERRFHLPATRQTTSEFLEAIHHRIPLSPEDRQTLQELLEQCDLIRFAAAPSSPDQAKALAATLRRFLQQSAR